MILWRKYGRKGWTDVGNLVENGDKWWKYGDSWLSYGENKVENGELMLDVLSLRMNKPTS